MNLSRWLIVTTLFWTIAGLAQDEELYPDPPPADAAFVRTVNALPDAQTPVLGERSFPEVAPNTASDYYVVLQGEAQLEAADISETLSIDAGKFYTLALHMGAAGPAATLLEDALNDNRAKSVVSLYNLSELASLELKTADGETAVVSGVAPLTTASVQVNPVAVNLAVFGGETAVAELGEVALERGALYSAIVLGPADAPTLLWELSETVADE